PLMLLAQWGRATLWTRAGEAPTRPKAELGWALLVGATSGAAVLTRPSWSLYVPAALFVWIVAEGRDRARRPAMLRGAALIVLGLLVVMAPWWVRNWRIYSKFVPTALWMGASLYDG